MGFKRIAITGLPGSGKTTLAKMLLVEYKIDTNMYITNKEYAFVHGDEVLPDNIVSICKVLRQFIAEHFCIADLLALQPEPLVEAIVVLDIPISICKMRMKKRKKHQVNTCLTFEELQRKMYASVKTLAYKGITVFWVDERDEKVIWEQKLVGRELMRFLISRKKKL